MYYQIFIEHFSKIHAVLYILIGNAKFKWPGNCDVAFLDLKKLVSTTPMLRGPNWEIPFHIPTDSSKIDIGVALGQ